MRVLLDSHPNIACGPEFKLTPLVLQQWTEFKAYSRAIPDAQRASEDLVDELYRILLLGMLSPYKMDQDKDRVAEKSPNNVMAFAEIRALFPTSPLIHVIRDGRDVVASLLGVAWINAETGDPFEYTRNATAAAEYWAACVTAGRTVSHAESYIEVRYEKLVSEPVATLMALCEAIGEPWAPEMIEGARRPRQDEPNAIEASREIDDSSVGRWHRDLSDEDKVAVFNTIGPLLAELGYT